jgi:hypothetical protein
MKQYCDGCLTFGGFGCKHSKFNKTGQCPCTNCILKMVCDSPCIKFDLWRGEDYVKPSQNNSLFNLKLKE